MSRLRKALKRSKALREENSCDLALSEREQLEYDIAELLSRECPEILGSKQKRIRLSYSKTKTIKADPEILLRNRIYYHTQESEVTKQIEKLRFQVLKKLEQMNVNSLMITSANHGEGKTFISTNLAVSIAQKLDRTVMLIDADLRNRTCRHQGVANIFFHSYNGAGLSDYLRGTARMADILINPGIPRLTLLPKGQGLLNSPSLLESAKMEELVFEMKSRYSNERIILFDCPSLLANADALIISRFVDAVLIVVENEKTHVNSLQRTIALLEDQQIIGTVMNKSR
jgi:non-specific protein-tyrosine kinase